MRTWVESLYDKRDQNGIIRVSPRATRTTYYEQKIKKLPEHSGHWLTSSCFIFCQFPSRHHGHRRSSLLLSTAHIDFTTERLMSVQVDRDRQIDVSIIIPDQRRVEQQQQQRTHNDRQDVLMRACHANKSICWL